MNNQIIDAIIEYIESKSELTEYEKDIIDTFKELNKNPEDRNDLLNQIINNKKYNIEKEECFLAEAQTQMKAVSKPISQLSTEELKGNLFNQLIIMCSKYNYRSGNFMP